MTETATQTPVSIPAGELSAEAYQQAGLAVFPLKARTKDPATAHGYKDATTDRERFSWDDHNVGLPMSMNGLVAIDVDDLNAEAVKLLDRYPTARQRTRKGFHAVYSTRETLSNSHTLGPGVDVRGVGYIVVEPSIHPDGHEYTWESRGIAPLPEEIRKRLRAAGQSAAPATSDQVGAFFADHTAEADDANFHLSERMGWARQLLTEMGRNETCIRVLPNVLRDAGAGLYSAQRGVEDLRDLLLNAEGPDDFRPEFEGMLPRALGMALADDAPSESMLGCGGALRPGVQRELQRLRDRAEAQRLFAEETGATPDVDWRERLTGGGGFVFDIPADLPSVWGDGTRSLWARGEALMLVGPSGVGKSTLAGQLVRAMVLGGGTVLGLPVRGMGKVLYLAMDRPAQLRRSLHRQFTEDERATLEQKLVVWAGPPPADLASDPGLLLEMCRAAGADVVVVDSLKDAALGLSEDTVGAAYNSARQAALAGGVEVLELHHQVKRGANGSAPTTLADVYGSGWITAGAGSVVLLHGEAGAASVELRHLKQPAEPVGPLTIEHDPVAGVSRVGEVVPRAALAEQKHRELMSRVHEYLTQAEAEGAPPPSKETLRKEVTGNNTQVAAAVDALKEQGYVKREYNGRFFEYTVARPFDLI